MATHGLTLGKYAPLHLGHQYVIETALREMDAVTVIIYDAPETTATPLSVRANWLRTLYPQLQVIEAWDGPTEVGDTLEIQQRHEDYILNRLKIRNITHFYSSEFYGEHMSRVLNAVNRLVDTKREHYSISSTRLRANLYENRQMVSPEVYRDLITRVVFVGAPSTGKTTLAKELASAFETVWMPEYGREYWETHQVERRLTPEQLVEIAEGHLEREDKLVVEANDYLFVDTNAITTYMFALDYHRSVHPRLVLLAQEAVSRYDLVFLCDADIPYANTWDRSGDVNRQIFQKRIIADLKMRRLPYILLQGDLKTRIQTVTQVLVRFQKYHNLGDYLFEKGT